ncbi:MAG: acetate/propionate family kinase [Porticoccaceae bacterium]
MSEALTLVLNCGSSSVKYRLARGADTLAGGAVDGIGAGMPRWRREPDGADAPVPPAVMDHRGALELILQNLRAVPGINLCAGLAAIGHRVVHGGSRFTAPALLDDTVVAAITQLIPLAPTHNPLNVLGIEVARQWFPGVPQVAVFDTAFHQTLPEHAWRYPLPATAITTSEGCELRRYGFHGISHASAARRAAAHLCRPLEELDLITLHLGNGASAAAIHRGRSIDTSMGFTPLEGLMMGTRCGDLDPALPLLMLTGGRDPEAVRALLERESGLKAVCGSSDMREVRQHAEAGDRDAVLAREMFCYRVKKIIGAYFAVLGRADAIVFTGGIGAHDADVRRQSCAGLEAFGIALGAEHIDTATGIITEHDSDRATVEVLAMVADEEAEIVRQTRVCLNLE